MLHTSVSDDRPTPQPQRPTPPGLQLARSHEHTRVNSVLSVGNEDHNVTYEMIQFQNSIRNWSFVRTRLSTSYLSEGLQ